MSPLSAPSSRTRPASTPRPALETLLGEKTLAPLIRRARWLDTLDRHLRAHLPAPLGLHARLGNVEGDTLIYLVDSPIWHARLRLSGETLLDAARGIGLQASVLRIRTARQPFDPYTRTLAAIDARMRHEHGASEAEARVLADAHALLAGPSGPLPSTD